MLSSPSFAVVAGPLSKKTLREFRRDAGWSMNMEEATSVAKGSLVHWAMLVQGKKQVGIARLELAAPQFCCVSELIISSPFRGKGLGRFFMKQIEQYCGRLRIQRLLLQPTEDTGGFYQSLYFIPDSHVPGFLKKEISPFQKKLLPQG